MASRALTALVLALIAAVWFGTLGQRELVRTDEGRYAEIAREMKVSGDFVTPTLNGLKYFEKPPLQYWATALSFHAFGESGFSARLWPALTGFLSVLFTLLTVRRLANNTLATIAATTHASMLWVYGMAQFSALDSALACWLHGFTCAYLLAYRSGNTPAQRTRWLVLATLSAGLAVLSKGLIGLLIPGACVGLYILFKQQWRQLMVFPWIKAGIAFLLLVAPWFVLVSVRNDEFAYFFFIHEHFTRFTDTEHHREGAPWYFVPLLFAGAFPWLVFVTAYFRRGEKHQATRAFACNIDVPLFTLLGCVFVFVFFSVSKSKLPSYILPIFGSLAITMSPAIQGVSRRFFLWALCPLALIALAIAVASHPALVQRFYTQAALAPLYTSMATDLRWTAALLLAAYGYALWRGGPAQRLQTVSVVACMCVISYAVGVHAYGRLTPMRSAYQLSKDIVASEGPLDDAAKGYIPFYSVDTFDHTFPFYMRRTLILVNHRDEMDLGLRAHPARFVNGHDRFLEQWKSSDQAYALMFPETFKALTLKDFPHRIVARDPRQIVVARK
jgi:4-amino-4-deoxy-L-arabinose transferase-like glycosyltransferase